MVSRAQADAERVQPESVEAWAAWLEANHDRSAGAWLVTWKKATGRQRFTYGEAVVEALRFGWIDAIAQRVDEERSMLWYGPRRAGSGWSRPNKERIARLEAAGRMHPAGQAVLDRARADGSWSKLDDVEALVVPNDLRAALDALPGAATHWDGFPPSARKLMLFWLLEAKRPETRAKRVAEVAAAAARGERAR